MANSQFVVSSKLHERNICSALSYLQQNGEFVDMTLAADGHFVKVHQIIIAIASPYIKDLIASAQCQHPVIFLNKISHATLAAILEYIYTGEVLVPKDHLKELVEAGKELHIKGLEDMNLPHATYVNSKNEMEEDDKTVMNEIYLETSSADNFITEETKVHDDSEIRDMHGEEIFLEMDEDGKIIDEGSQDDNEGIQTCFTGDHSYHDKIGKNLPAGISKVKITNVNSDTEGSSLQYTVSNQGSLQMILNRYMYYLKYTNRNRARQWRCVDYLKSIRCPAHVVTRDDVVVQRISAHTHPFHDERILKKLRAGAIFSALLEAEKEGENILRSKSNAESIQSE